MDFVRVLFYWSKTQLHETQEFARRIKHHGISFAEEPGGDWSIAPKADGPIELAIPMSQPWERAGLVRDTARRRRFTSNGALDAVAAALAHQPCPYDVYQRHYMWASEYSARIRRVCLVIGAPDRHNGKTYAYARTQLEACGIEFWSGALFEYLEDAPPDHDQSPHPRRFGRRSVITSR
jgi:hypothetical protein